MNTGNIQDIKYDDKGRVAEIRSRGSESYVISYNDTKKEISVEYHSGMADNHSQITVFSYDGKILKETHKYFSGTEHVGTETVYNYANGTKVITDIYNSTLNNGVAKIVTTCDLDDNVLSVKKYDADGNEITE